MGQTTSQNTNNKNIRNEFLKSNNPNQHHFSTAGPGGTGPNGASTNPLSYGNYASEELNEEDETVCPTINSKSSYSPSESIPTFKFSTLVKQESVLNKKIPVVFKYMIKTAREVYLIGTFTSWKDKIQMIKSDGDFITIVDLPEGEHQYKFVVDGKWEHDPNQPTVDDNFNGKNNIVTVKKSDFEVMDALAMDIQNQAPKSITNNIDDLSRSPPGEYSDDYPNSGVNVLPMDKPPYLPPQLLNIVLNKDTSVRCEPALLPEPNHVMLKHLYALSIRDGVMVLSSTFRYKQKFITTCFYKPI